MDHHRNSFDEGTLTKLDIFQTYAESWLSIFAVTRSMQVTDLWIWDFFAGPGQSICGQDGSPLRILKVIEAQACRIIENNRTIHVRFNEKDKKKFRQLISVVESYSQSSGALKMLTESRRLEVQCINMDFADLFKKVIPCLGSAPALMLFDQNGVKYISDEYLLPLLKSKLTDFLFFVSTSYFARFSSMPEFRKNVTFEWNPEKPYNFIHREILDYVRHKIPTHSKMRVYPFSIKKNSNIYGLIFGGSHVLAAEKFLDIAWNKNKLNGEANFDIDDDCKKHQACLFEEFKNLTKIEQFYEDVKGALLSGKIKNNHEAYYYAINNGFLPTHIAAVLKRLKKQKIISYEGNSPLVSYKEAYKLVKTKGFLIYKVLL